MPQKQGSSGRKNRKKGDWENISKGRMNRNREIVERSNRDYPKMNSTGSAAYQRMSKKG